MKITSKVLYKVFRETLGSQLKNAGYKRTRGGLLGWHQDAVTFWFQCDKYGWDDDWGSRFNLEFQYNPDDSRPGTGSIRNRTRFRYLLSSSDMDAVLAANNGVIERLPGTMKSKHTVVEVEGQEVIVLGFKPSGGYEPGEDVWLHFYASDDVNMWAQFFSERLDGMLARFSKQCDA